MDRTWRWWLRRLLIGLLIIVVVLALGAWGYARMATAAPTPVALAALESDEQVTVSQNGWITFVPADGIAETGLILYPGGFVDPRAYAPVARQIAAAGYQVVIPSMPLNLAVLRPSRANAVMAAYPDIQRWAVGGHSLGGAMAAQYAADHPDAVDGLVLWAAYPPQGVDLSGASMAATSIYGTNDGLVSQQDIDDSRDRLPPTTEFVSIVGGNHAQFGSYGAQNRDRPADISETDQHAQIAAATMESLAAMTALP